MYDIFCLSYITEMLQQNTIALTTIVIVWVRSHWNKILITWEVYSFKRQKR